MQAVQSYKIENGEKGTNFYNALNSVTGGDIGDMTEEEITKILLKNQYRWATFMLDVNSDMHEGLGDNADAQYLIMIFTRLISTQITPESFRLVSENVVPINNGFMHIVRMLQDNDSSIQKMGKGTNATRWNEFVDLLSGFSKNLPKRKISTNSQISALLGEQGNLALTEEVE